MTVTEFVGGVIGQALRYSVGTALIVFVAVTVLRWMGVL